MGRPADRLVFPASEAWSAELLQKSCEHRERAGNDDRDGRDGVTMVLQM